LAYAGAMQRRVLGVIALTLIVVGGLGTFLDVFGEHRRTTSGVALRSGLILGAFWLVLPRARDVPRPVWIGVAVFAGFLAVRPRLFLLGLVLAFIAMVAVALAQRRSGTV